MKTALVIGATGLVGTQLVDLLIKDDRFSTIKIFVRRTTGRKNAKIQEHIIDFDKQEQWKQMVTGDVLFSSMGTTIKKAGSQDAQYKIDYTYQYNFAKAAAENGVAAYVLVSSAGASAQSKIFYNRMKGELENAVKQLPFAHISIMQPGILAGNRQEFRPGEKIGIAVMSVFKYIPGLTRFRPIDANIVAKAMINASFKNKKPVATYTLQQVFDEAETA